MSADPYNPPKTAGKSGGGALKWILIILAILAVVLAICIGTCVWGGAAFFGTVMAPLNDMTEVLKQNAEVTEKLGTPIEQVAITDGGKFNSEINNSNATILMTVKGPKGQADVEGTMTKSGDKWVPQNITVTFDDGTTLDL